MNPYVKNLNRIEFFVTLACTGRCKHCSEGEHLNYNEYIDSDFAAEIVHKICGKFHIKSLMTFGGDACREWSKRYSAVGRRVPSRNHTA